MPTSFGVESPCPACRLRNNPAGVREWSQVVRLQPDARVMAVNELRLWLTRMMTTPTVCNDCTRQILILAVEFIHIIDNINPNA